MSHRNSSHKSASKGKSEKGIPNSEISIEEAYNSGNFQIFMNLAKTSGEEFLTTVNTKSGKSWIVKIVEDQKFELFQQITKEFPRILSLVTDFKSLVKKISELNNKAFIQFLADNLLTQTFKEQAQDPEKKTMASEMMQRAKKLYRNQEFDEDFYDHENIQKNDSLAVVSVKYCPTCMELVPTQTNILKLNYPNFILCVIENRGDLLEEYIKKCSVKKLAQYIDNKGNTFLHYCAKYDFQSPNFECNKTAYESNLYTPNEEHYLPIHIAIINRSTNFIQNRKNQTDFQKAQNVPSLYHAAAKYNIPEQFFNITADPSVLAKKYQNNTVSEIAAANCSYSVLLQILPHIDVNSIISAFATGYKGNDEKSTKTLNLLIQNDVDVNQLLAAAKTKNNSDLYTAVKPFLHK